LLAPDSVYWFGKVGQDSWRSANQSRCAITSIRCPFSIVDLLSVVRPRYSLSVGFCSAGLPIHRSIPTPFYPVLSTSSVVWYTLMLEQCGLVHSFLDLMAQYFVDYLHGAIIFVLFSLRCSSLLGLKVSESTGRCIGVDALDCIRHPALFSEPMAVPPRIWSPSGSFLDFQRTGSDYRHPGPVSGIDVHYRSECFGRIRLRTAVLCLQNRCCKPFLLLTLFIFISFPA
jgi:hypothetical protein